MTKQASIASSFVHIPSLSQVQVIEVFVEKRVLSSCSSWQTGNATRWPAGGGVIALARAT